MASEIPFPYITGLPEEAQRQIERNFLEVQKNLGSISHPWYFLAASDASADEKARADYVFDGATDSAKMAAIFAAHPGGHYILSGGNFNLTVTLDCSAGKVAAMVGIGERGGHSYDNTTINFNDNGVGGALTSCDAGGALIIVDVLYLAFLDIQYNGALNVSAFLGDPNANAGTVTADHVGLGNMLTVMGTTGSGNFAACQMFAEDVIAALSGAVGTRFSTENFPAGHRLVNFQSRTGSISLGQLTQCIVVNPIRCTWTELAGGTNYILDSRGAANSFRGNATGSTAQVLDIAASSVPALIGTDKNLLPAALDLPKGIQTYPAPTSFPPSGSATGSLTGTYPAPTFAGRDSSVDQLNKDMLPVWVGAEPLGIQTIPAATGSSSPTGAAGGSLNGSYPNPTFSGRDSSVDKINQDMLPSMLVEAFGVQVFPAPFAVGRDLSVDAINKDMLPTWVGAEPIGIQTIPTPTPGSAPTGAAGGSLAGTYPNPTFSGRDTSTDAINKDMLPSAVTEAPSGVQHIPPQLRRTGTGEIFDRAVQVLAGLAAGALTPTTDQIKANDAIVNRPSGAITQMSANGPGTAAAFEWGAAGSTDVKVYRKSAGNLELPGVLTSYDDLLPIVPLGIQTIPATGGGGAPTGAAGGSLAGTYPNPTFAGRDTSTDALNKDMLPSVLVPPLSPTGLITRFPHLAGGTAGTGLLIPQIAWDTDGKLTNVNNIAPQGGIDPTAWHNSDIGPMMTGDASGIQTYGGGTVGTTTQALLDFGAFPVFEKSFTVTDASVLVGMRILCSIAMDSSTGRQPDELEMDDLYATASVVSNGVLQVNVASDGRKGPVMGKFNLNYIVPVTVTQSIPSHASTHGRGASDPLDLLFKDMTQQFMMMG